VKVSEVGSLLLLMAVVLCGCQGEPRAMGPTPTVGLQREAAPSPVIVQTVEYHVRETLTLVNTGPGRPTKQNLWMAMIRDVSPYQSVRSMQVRPDGYRRITDEYGNQYAEFDLSDMAPGATVSIEFEYRVAVHELAYELADCIGEVPTFFTRPELHVESNNVQIIDLAGELSEGKGTACEQVRAFYDYVGNRLVYSYNGADWGAQATLGEMGADCTEYSSLMMALSRAAGIPARYLEGLWAPGRTAQDQARTEHAWLEVYLPGVGWTPMDPTLGRSSVSREEYFAHLPPDHIIVTVGRSPSTLRGASYWTHLYWPGKSTEIRVEKFDWQVTPARK
jgi:transglutaminase-like putative cysteine protease